MWMRRCRPCPSHKPESSKSTHVVVSPSCGCRCFPFFPLCPSLSLSFVVPTHVASAPFLSEAFGKIEYADDRDRGRGSGGGGAKANAEAASPPSLPPPAMQTKFGATGKSY